MPEFIAREGREGCPPLAVPALVVVIVVAGIVAVLSATRYGYYYDELYFIAAGKRPSFSYADQGPLVPLLARAMDWLAPGSFLVLRIPAIIAALATAVISALIAREVGGGRIAQVLTAVACCTAFGILGETTTLTTNIIDTPLWALLTWLIVRWVRVRRDVLLIAAVVVTLVALQVKWLIPIFWIAILIGVGCVGPREMLCRPVLWWGAGAAAISAIPALIWQSRHAWPQAAMGSVIRGQTSMLFGPLTFLPRAVQMCGVLGAVLSIYGLWRLLRSPHLRPYRFVGVAFLIVVTIFALAGGRVQYGVGIYAAVIATGAVELVAVRRDWSTVGAVPAIAASIVAFVVWATPWRPVSQLVPATDFTAGLANLAYGEFGWPELASAVADAYQGLSPDQRRSAVIVTERYIQASALDYHRTSVELPAVYSPKRGFGYFGGPPNSTQTVLWVGSNKTGLKTWFTSVSEVAKFDVRLGMPEVTRGITIWKCTGPRQPWSTMWPKMQTL
ncbi:glycosyltransferase family 39 protein [Mycobacteroides abscessus subsp. abscessus]|uniref:ArnT family glycosyltransferase n=1 Tax=Mycobacteroides abscessus TaxID=36809 RepID=UPI0019D0E4CD|nr:glycosyltransferase family 39 protein [Mycobacteroides abscessus]MBN7438527.1 glycosyltransferase family 39 protein [Mycobacteroides abscessus subsp. abscessus]